MKINFSAIIKKIPEPVKKYIRPIYHKWSIGLEERVIKDLMEYFYLDKKKVMHLLESGGNLSSDFWYCLNPKTAEEIKNFYKENPFYVFNLIMWHGTRQQIKLRSRIVELAKGRVLDYGGAVGDMCIMAVNKKLETEYADLPGRTYDFAKWVFGKRGYRIPMIDLSKEKILRNYDTIFCIDVIEHVTNPKDLLSDFAAHLNKGGYLMITALDPITGEEIPMHFGFDFDPEEYLKSLGMEKGEESFLWIKK